MELTNEKRNWSADEDLILLEAVLRQIRANKSQITAFKEVSLKLGRSVDSVRNRWYNELKEKYSTAIQIAKGQSPQEKQTQSQQQQKEKINLFNTEENDDKEKLSFSENETIQDEKSQIDDKINLIEEVIKFLKENQDILKIKQELQEVKEKNLELEAQNKKLLKEYNELTTKYEQIVEDYRALIKVLEKAREIFGEEKETKGVKFKMDRYGNVKLE